MEAVGVKRVGNANLYALQGIAKNGKWCKLPQQHLCDTYEHMYRLNPGAR